jgi:HPt (histidine-containing phosphotransfer) domain-containing protein
MGLGEDEAVEFVKELIPQIKIHIPLIKEAMEASDFHNMERLTHSIKGSSTTVGSGGISDLLVEYNTYLKTGKELPVVEAYFKHLNHYCNELEKEYA